ncbi:MAG: hypothetical protein BWY53_00673 [Parcubacteria group bacterium ADurb.Bin326]|nr:MAG: hypothetical protein BWY53_00673 [Parcubacteria group bacterium ADurb.Bin326]
MKSNIIKLVIAVVISVLILAVALFFVLFLYRFVFFKEEKKVIVKSNSDLIINQEVSGDQVIIDCINELKEKNSDSDFAPGWLIVTFKPGVSLDVATDIVKSYNLTSPRTWAYKNIPNILYVFVPKNQELKWLCTLKQNENIKGVELNLKLELH